MAYCLRSLVQILEQMMYPHQHHKKWVLNHDSIPQIQSLLENVIFLRDFLDNSSPMIQGRITSLEDKIMDAAEMAEDSIESHITRQILSSPENLSFMIILPDLRKVMQVFEVAKQEVIEIMDTVVQESDNNVLPTVSSTRYPHVKNVVVGVKEDLIQLKSRLIARASKFDVIPIVGMGGMGKTTLARILYDEYSSSKFYFDCCAWVTVSQSYDPQLILRTILACVTGKTLSEIPHQGTNILIVALYQNLFSRRYLVILDDIWSCKAWDDLQTTFPRDNNGSRIIMTTREKSVADYVKSNSHEMHLINADDSWELLTGKIFGGKSCPPELEDVGKRIARNCGGLPLALQVIGGLLAQSQRSIFFWEHVAHNISSLLEKTDEQVSGIFSWSFAHLPHYLKPCFLYMSAFPEDYKIPATEVTKLLVAEGFVFPVPDKSLEEAADIHLNALVDRNLIFVRERKSSGKAKSYGMHDLLRDLCLKKAHEKKFIYFMESKANNLQEDTIQHRRVSFYSSHKSYPSMKLTPNARSFLSIGDLSPQIFSCLCFKLSLLRALDLFTSRFHKFPEIILDLVNLRYLAILAGGDTPTKISILNNLQTLIIDNIPTLTIMADMLELRHLKFYNMPDNCKGSLGLHENLQSLSDIPHEALRELLGKLPNLRKLGIECSLLDYTLDLTCFHNLESLDFLDGFGVGDATFIADIIFPSSLTRLRLFSCVVPRSLLEAISVLPSLQTLKIDFCGIESRQWEPSEGGFCKLQHLVIESYNLVHWLATEIHFPVLRHLVLRNCEVLNEIPNDLGGIETLEIIEVDRCRLSVFDSATRIYEEQYQFGNTLQLRLGNPLKEKKKDIEEHGDGEDVEHDDEDDEGGED